MAFPTMPSNITSASTTLYVLLRTVTFVTEMKIDLFYSHQLNIYKNAGMVHPLLFPALGLFFVVFFVFVLLYLLSFLSAKATHCVSGSGSLGSATRRATEPYSHGCN